MEVPPYLTNTTVWLHGGEDPVLRMEILQFMADHGHRQPKPKKAKRPKRFEKDPTSGGFAKKKRKKK